MTYELAKKLKDAGFPQKNCVCGGSGFIFKDKQTSERGGKADFPCPCSHEPTLSELIEACGLKNFGLCRNNARIEEMSWSAFDHAIYDLAENFGDSPTPEEAVANLWLALNKK